MKNCNASKTNLKRLFFAFELDAPWPEKLPEGRILSEKNRHLTLAFLGTVNDTVLKEHLLSFPAASFDLGLIGTCDHLSFLPEQNPRVVATHVKWMHADIFSAYLARVQEWLLEHHYRIEKIHHLSHVTLARAPFSREAWENIFSPFPFFVKGLHLYETVESLEYNSLWCHSFIPPFEEIEHTADLAFLIRGKDLKQLYEHAQIALSFKFPPLLPFFLPFRSIENLDQLIISLNALIAQADCEIGCPLKAISFHGIIAQHSNDLLNWEMIVDV